jgi:hypothetical protein
MSFISSWTQLLIFYFRPPNICAMGPTLMIPGGLLPNLNHAQFDNKSHVIYSYFCTCGVLNDAASISDDIRSIQGWDKWMTNWNWCGRNRPWPNLNILGLKHFWGYVTIRWYCDLYRYFITINTMGIKIAIPEISLRTQDSPPPGKVACF